jgi:hypothetical protein
LDRALVVEVEPELAAEAEQEEAAGPAERAVV